MYLDVFGVEAVGAEVGVLLLLNPKVVHFVGVDPRSKAEEFRLD